MNDFQRRAMKWAVKCIGEHDANDTQERNWRFLEEALELFQSRGGDKGAAYKLVNYTFGRPAGNPAQEVGGVMTTLAVLCSAAGLNLVHCAEDELARNWENIQKIGEKHKSKIRSNSPLPGDSKPLEPHPSELPRALFYVETPSGPGAHDDLELAAMLGRLAYCDLPMPISLDEPPQLQALRKEIVKLDCMVHAVAHGTEFEKGKFYDWIHHRARPCVDSLWNLINRLNRRLLEEKSCASVWKDAADLAERLMLDRIRGSLKDRLEGRKEGGDVGVMELVDQIVANESKPPKRKIPKCPRCQKPMTRTVFDDMDHREPGWYCRCLAELHKKDPPMMEVYLRDNPQGQIDPTHEDYVGHNIACRNGAPCLCNKDENGFIIENYINCPWHGR